MKYSRDLFKRAGIIVMALVLIFYGVVAILQNRWTYENYWGGGVFAPVAILFGLLLIYGVLFRYNAMKKPRVDKKGRRIRFPADDYRKW